MDETAATTDHHCTSAILAMYKQTSQVTGVIQVSIDMYAG